VTIRSQAFWWAFLDPWATRKGLCIGLRALRSPETGNPLVTYQALAEGCAYPDRRNVQNYWPEFEACEADFEAYLRRKRNVDAAGAGAVTEEGRQTPFASEAVGGAQVSARLKRDDLRPVTLQAALEQGPGTVSRSPLRREWEPGVFHPNEAVLLQDALAIFQRSSSGESRGLVEPFEETGITAAADERAAVVQRQPADAVPAVLNPTLPGAQIPDRMRLMVGALTRYFWKVPLSRLGVGVGVSKRTGSPWVRPGGGALSGHPDRECPGRAGGHRSHR